MNTRNRLNRYVLAGMIILIVLSTPLSAYAKGEALPSQRASNQERSERNDQVLTAVLPDLTLPGNDPNAADLAAPGLHTVGGCTGAPFGYVCISMTGVAGTTAVYKASVVRGKADFSLICNFGGRVYVKNPAGKIVWTQAMNHKGCSYGRAWFTFNVFKSFEPGSKVCARFREDGVQQGGEPCVTLKGRVIPIGGGSCAYHWTRNLKQGMRGKDVAELQRRLNKALGATLAVDGIFGPKTKQAAANFQRFKGLSPVTGDVGPRTRAALDKVCL
jgi:Putative peptidoglycan binding domain